MSATTANLSTIIDSKIKKAITEFCKKRGLKIRYLIENALIEYLEDEIDLEAYRSRQNEDTIPLEKILSEMK